MAARSTMLALLARLTQLIGDDASDPEFSADKLQTFIDTYRMKHHQAHLQPIPTTAEGGAVLYYEFRAGISDWESAATLYDNQFAEIDSADYTQDDQAGTWTFTVGLSTPLVYVTGSTYDLHGAAADALEAWAAKLSRKADMSDGDLRLSRSQMAKSLRENARQFRARQRVGSARMVRTDVC